MVKMKKLPKRPKASASLKVWENYETKVKAVQSDNAKTLSEVNKKAAIVKRSAGAKAVKGKRK